MKDIADIAKLYAELDSREDEGKRFYHDVIINQEYIAATHKDIVIDLGANVGNFSYYIYPQAAKIYAIEANTNNFTILKEYVDRYNMEKIIPFNLAIAGANGVRSLYASGGCGGFTLLGETLEQQIEAKTLATFMQDNHIAHVDLLKIDVESAEDEIFAAPDFAEAARKISFIIGENHGRNIIEPLEKAGFHFSQNGVTFIAKRYE